jgi:hypothetical protein
MRAFLIGGIVRERYRLELRMGTVPEGAKLPPDTPYYYLTKLYASGEIGTRSIGLLPTDLLELRALLNGLEIAPPKEPT